MSNAHGVKRVSLCLFVIRRHLIMLRKRAGVLAPQTEVLCMATKGWDGDCMGKGFQMCGADAEEQT